MDIGGSAESKTLAAYSGEARQFCHDFWHLAYVFQLGGNCEILCNFIEWHMDQRFFFNGIDRFYGYLGGLVEQKD